MMLRLDSPDSAASCRAVAITTLATVDQSPDPPRRGGARGRHRMAARQ